MQQHHFFPETTIPISICAVDTQSTIPGMCFVLSKGIQGWEDTVPIIRTFHHWLSCNVSVFLEESKKLYKTCKWTATKQWSMLMVKKIDKKSCDILLELLFLHWPNKARGGAYRLSQKAGSEGPTKGGVGNNCRRRPTTSSSSSTSQQLVMTIRKTWIQMRNQDL